MSGRKESSAPSLTALALASLLAWGAALPAAAQEGGQGAPAIGEACRGEEHRAFDYWMGEWTVRNPDGEVVGHNTISRVSDGCALLEEWRSANGSTGTSINFHDPRSGTWRQTWVGGGGGLILDLEGGPENGAMVLQGEERETPRGAVRDRITWTLLEDGRVEQLWEISTNGGASWDTAFRGLYEKTDGGSGM